LIREFGRNDFYYVNNITTAYTVGMAMINKEIKREIFKAMNLYQPLK